LLNAIFIKRSEVICAQGHFQKGSNRKMYELHTMCIINTNNNLLWRMGEWLLFNAISAIF